MTINKTMEKQYREIKKNRLEYNNRSYNFDSLMLDGNNAFFKFDAKNRQNCNTVDKLTITINYDSNLDSCTITGLHFCGKKTSTTEIFSAEYSHFLLPGFPVHKTQVLDTVKFCLNHNWNDKAIF